MKLLWKTDMSEIEKICQYCKRSYLGKKSSKYCSKKCVSKALSQRYSGSGNTQYKGGKVEKICKNCGERFLGFPCENNRPWQNKHR